MKHIIYLCLCSLVILGSAGTLAVDNEQITSVQVAADQPAAAVAGLPAEARDTATGGGETETGTDRRALVTDELVKQAEMSHDRDDEQTGHGPGQFNQGFPVNLGSHHGGVGDTIVAVVAITFTVGMPIIIVSLVLLASHRKRRQQIALIEKFLDAGKDVPAEVLASLDRESAGGNNLRRGLLLTGIGIGLFLFLGFVAGWAESTIGLIPLFIGLAQLLIWKIENSRQDKSAQS